MRIRFVGTRAIAAIVLFTATALSTGCKFGPDFERPKTEIEQTWREEHQRFVAGRVDRVEWWREFNDPVLTRLIELAIENNPELQIAALNVVQARTARAVGFLTFFPFITGGGSASHVNFSQTVKPEVEVTIPELGPIADALGEAIPRPEVTLSDSLDYYSVGVDAIWEVDLWGIRRRNFEALSAQLGAAFADYDDVLVSVIAEVGLSYIEIRAADERIEALEQVLKLQENFQSVAQERFNRGVAPETDFLLATALAGMTASAIPPIKYQKRVAGNALAILTGLSPAAVEVEMVRTSGIPLPPASIVLGIPTDLLRRRPDVRRAEYVAHAQCARIGVAKAQILPSFTLFGGIGLRSTDSDRLFESDSLAGSYGVHGNITSLINYPLFVQNVRIQDAQFEQALLDYEQAVLDAKLEAENAMYSFLMAGERIEILKPTLNAAERASLLSISDYRDGDVIVSVPLAALEMFSEEQDNLIATRAGAAMQVVALNKALGGGWELRQQEQLLPEELRERMKDRSDWWSFGGRRALDTQRQLITGDQAEE